MRASTVLCRPSVILVQEDTVGRCMVRGCLLRYGKFFVGENGKKGQKLFPPLCKVKVKCARR